MKTSKIKKIKIKLPLDVNGIIVDKFVQSTKNMKLDLVRKRFKEKMEEKEKAKHSIVTFSQLKHIEDTFRQIKLPKIGDIFNFNFKAKKTLFDDIDKTITEKRKFLKLQERSLDDLTFNKTFSRSNSVQGANFHLRHVLWKNAQTPTATLRRGFSLGQFEELKEQEELKDYLKKELIDPKKLSLLDRYTKFETSARNFYDSHLSTFYTNFNRNVKPRISCFNTKFCKKKELQLFNKNQEDKEIRKKNKADRRKMNQAFINRMLNHATVLESNIEEERKEFKKRNFIGDRDVDNMMDLRKDMKFLNLKNKYLSRNGILNFGNIIKKKSKVGFIQKFNEEFSDVDTATLKNFNMNKEKIMKDFDGFVKMLKKGKIKF